MAGKRTTAFELSASLLNITKELSLAKLDMIGGF
jgi:hypothetical protein